MPITGSALLDTNAAIALTKSDQSLVDVLNDAEKVYVPSVVLGEMFYGAYKSGRVKANVARVEKFAADSAVLDCDKETARHYGQIKQELRRKGRPIPENDIWIAAIARQYDLTVVTHDTHFQEVDDLEVETW